MKFIDTINLITKWIAIGTWIVYGIWQLFLVILRLSKINVNLISMTEKDLGYGGLAALVYFWCGFATHWWVTWHKPVWNTPIPAILFWLIGFAYLAADLAYPIPHGGGPQWQQIIRYPAVVAGIGAFSGWALFPQGKPNWSPF